MENRACLGIVAVLAACAMGGSLFYMANLLPFSSSQQFENRSGVHIEIMMRRFQVQLANGLSNMSDQLENGLSGMRHDLSKISGWIEAMATGQNAVSESSVSIHSGPNMDIIGSGSLVYLNRINAGVVVTNLHVAANRDENCSRKITVQSGDNKDVGVSHWFVLNDSNVDVAFGLLKEKSKYSLLNITERENVQPGLQIWGHSLQPDGPVALSGRVVSNLKSPFSVLTDVGGAPGFSGTAYVDYMQRLALIHVGSESIDLESTATNFESSDSEHLHKMQTFSKNCRHGTALSMSGNADYVDACVELIKLARSSGEPGQVDFNVMLRLETQCRTGWNIVATGKISTTTHFIKDCIDLFSGRNVSFRKAGKCRQGWARNFAKDPNHVHLCLSFVEESARHSPDAPDAGERCKRAIYEDNMARAEQCEKFVALSARNPRARGVGAWVLNDASFALVDRNTAFQQEC